MRRCLAISAALVVAATASCHLGEEDQPSAFLDGPDFSLGPGESRAFVLHTCFGDANPKRGSVSLDITLDAESAPAGMGELRLLGRMGADPNFVDAPAPGEMYLFGELVRGCDEGTAVVFQRLDSNPDGQLAVTWVVQAAGVAPGDDDAFTLTIE